MLTRLVTGLSMLILSAGLACTAGGTAQGTRPGAAAGSGGAAGSAGSSAGSPNVGGIGGLVVSVDGGPLTGSAGCSIDLHDVLGESGEVVETCPPDRACSANGCVPACQAFTELHGSVGCDFLAATPSVMTLYKPGCFAVFVTNAWNRDATIRVSRGGETLDVQSFGRVVGDGADPAAWPAVPAAGIAPDQVAVLFLSHDPQGNSGDGTNTTCPISPAVSVPGGAAVHVRPSNEPGTPAEQTGKGMAFHIETDGPVSAYGILPFGGARSVDPSATMLYPTSVWGNNYVAVVPPEPQEDDFNSEWGQLLASSDATTIELVPTVNLPAGPGVAAAAAGQSASFTLNAGEFIQWQDAREMTGTVMLADKPIAFYGGASALSYESSMPECENGATDNAHQQLPPVAALGHEYVAAPYRSRIAIPESVPYRFVGFVDGTTLTYDPPQAAAPSTLNLGSIVDFEAVGAFSVRAQDSEHPFYVAQFMTGCGQGDPTGDEEFVNVIPSAQYLSKYVFFTDPTYGTTNLVLVRKKSGSGFAEVEVDCVGPVSGWVNVDSAGTYQITDVDLVRHGVGTGTCTNGRHVASSAGPFALIVWGLDTWASYGYPAGSGAAPINAVLVVPVVK